MPTPNAHTEPGFPKGLGQPALRALAAAGVSHLDQLTRFTEKELLSLHGMGPKAVGIIKAALAAEQKTLAKEV